MNWYLEQMLGILVFLVVMVAVAWEIYHLAEWAAFLSEDPVGYLREHARTYVEWMFGTDFGWSA